MNTLQDLRDTLDQHASDIESADVGTARVAAVRGRARRVRRQRAAGIGVAAVLAVAAASVVPMLGSDRTPVPADRQIIGKVAPATLTSLGYTYHFAEAFSSSDRPAVIRLRTSEEPRLVTWASTADEVSVDANVEGYSTRSSGVDFDDFVLVPGAESPTFRVRAGGAESAIAVYELGDERPPGHTVDGITWRAHVADEELMSVQTGDEGESEVGFTITLSDGRLRIAELCMGTLPEGYVFNSAVGDDGAVSSGGCGDDGFDPGQGNGYSFRVRPGEVGDRAWVHAWVSRRPGGPPVDVDGVRLGIAAYDVKEPAATVAGQDVPSLVEYEGKLWRYRTGRSVGFTGAGRASTVNRFGEPVLVAGYFTGVAKGSMVRFRHGKDGTDVQGGGAGGPLETVLQPGDSARMSARTGESSSGQLGWASYLRAD